MNYKLIKNLIIFLFVLPFTSCGNTDSAENPDNQNEPVLTEHYYFEGKLDNEPFLIEQKYYSNFYDEKPFRIDYGGTLINCVNEPTNDVHTGCYTHYACGILIDKYLSPEGSKTLNSAKMYFGPINVEKRTFEVELDSLKNFLKTKELEFRRDFGSVENQGAFAFDFFPPNPDSNDQFYYSSRFNDNAGFIANITSVKEIEDYFFVIEGTVDRCKLYDSREIKDENQAYKLLTEFKFRVKINGIFNYNNYKND